MTFVTNAVYQENYETMPMKHSWSMQADSLSVEYLWQKKNWNSLKIIATPTAHSIREGSEEEFIIEHYCGYT